MTNLMDHKTALLISAAHTALRRFTELPPDRLSVQDYRLGQSVAVQALEWLQAHRALTPWMDPTSASAEGC